jgi:ABC-type Zn2+ transport system substrate-binding protein/surface adhesin
MELEVPGMDIVGFEHAAESADQKAAVTKAEGQLEQPLALFKLPEAAGCKVAGATVAIEAEHEHEDGEKHEEHAKGDHDAHEGHAGHNEFHVTYALDCAKPAALTHIDFEYFKSFTGANKLTVNVVTQKAQNTYEVTRDKPALDLGGMM